MAQHLRLFPALRLNRLTMVRGCCYRTPELRHEAFYGSGWREFRTIVPFDTFSEGRLRGFVQKCHKYIVERDGIESGACVIAYQNSQRAGFEQLSQPDLHDEPPKPMPIFTKPEVSALK